MAGRSWRLATRRGGHTDPVGTTRWQPRDTLFCGAVAYGRACSVEVETGDRGSGAVVQTGIVLTRRLVMSCNALRRKTLRSFPCNRHTPSTEWNSERMLTLTNSFVILQRTL